MRVLFLVGLLAIWATTASAEEKPDSVAARLLECAPANYGAAVDCLEAHLSKDSLETLRKDGAVMAHFGLGMWLRNNWGLWAGSPLQRSLAEQGFLHPDDMSGAILDGLVARLRGETFDLDAKIAYYKEYWEKSDQREEVPCEGEEPTPGWKCYIDSDGSEYKEKVVEDN